MSISKPSSSFPNTSQTSSSHRSDVDWKSPSIFFLLQKYPALKPQRLKPLCFPQVAGSYQTKPIYFSQLHPRSY